MVLNQNQYVSRIGITETNKPQTETVISNETETITVKNAADTTEQSENSKGVSAEIQQALANIKTIYNLLSDNKPTNWIIKKYIPTQSISMIHGESGAGKTFLTLDMTLVTS